MWPLVAGALLGSLPGAGWLYQSWGQRRDLRRYPIAGHMVRVGPHDLHVVEQGTASSTLPLIVFESGIGGSSISWAPIQEAAAALGPTLSYDRAGLGWSSAAQTPRTASQIAGELHALLAACGHGGPFLLVGHSFGGQVCRLFSQLYPELVCGLVLVDPEPVSHWHPLHPNQGSRLRRGVQLSRRGAWLAQFGVVRFCIAMVQRGSALIPQRISKMSASGQGAAFLNRLTREIQKLPRESWPVVGAQWCLPKNFRGMAAHLASLPESMRQCERVRCPEEIPLILLSAGLASPAARLEHQSMASAPNSELRIAENSGHWIQLDEPNVVLNAIGDLLRRAQREVAN